MNIYEKFNLPIEYKMKNITLNAVSMVSGRNKCHEIHFQLFFSMEESQFMNIGKFKRMLEIITRFSIYWSILMRIYFCSYDWVCFGFHMYIFNTHESAKILYCEIWVKKGENASKKKITHIWYIRWKTVW